MCCFPKLLTSEISLPGGSVSRHSLLSHETVMKLLPIQYLELRPSLHVLVRVLLPGPHETVHSDHLDHPAQFTGTKNRN